MPSRKVQQIKTKGWQRQLSIGAWGAKSLGRWVVSRVTAKQSTQQVVDNIVEDLVNRLSELKGSFTKIGQLISIYGEFFLPPEVLPAFKTLQNQTTAVDFNVIYQVLKKQLGPRLSEFDIDQEPIGCASLAQVHRCYHKPSGQMWVFKVQYPGIKSAIRSDVNSLKQWLRLWRLLPEGRGVDALFEEIRQMLLAELDYEHERKWTQIYAEKLAEDKRFKVPQVYPEYCTPSVLVMEYIPSERIDSPLVQKASLTQRQQWSEAFLDLYFRELFHWKWVQTDPHLGNFGIDAKDLKTIVLYDFGALREYPSSFLNRYYRLIYATLKGDADEIIRLAVELGFLDQDDSPKIKSLFVDFCFTVMEPFYEPQDARLGNPSVMDEQGYYDWVASDINRRLAKISWELIRSFHIKPPPKEVLFLDRKTGGIFVLARTLAAPTQPRKLLIKYLNEALKLEV